MRHRLHAFNLNTDIKNRINKGEQLIAYTSVREIDEPKHQELYKKILESNPKGVLHVGFELGQHLANLKRLSRSKGKNILLSGWECSPLHKSYGRKYFDLSELELRTNTDNFCNEVWKSRFDIVFSTGLLSQLKDKSRQEILEKMISLANRKVLLLEPKFNMFWIEKLKGFSVNQDGEVITLDFSVSKKKITGEPKTVLSMIDSKQDKKENNESQE